MHVFLNEVAVRVREGFQWDDHKLRRLVFEECQHPRFRCLGVYLCKVCLLAEWLRSLKSDLQAKTILEEAILLAIQVYFA